MGNLGCVFQNRGEYSRTVGFFTEALELEMENRQLEGLHLGNLGNTYQGLVTSNSPPSRIRMPSLFTKRWATVGAKGSTWQPGGLYVKAGRLKDAERAFRQAILLRDQNLPLAAGVFRGSLALLLSKFGEWEKRLPCLLSQVSGGEQCDRIRQVS